MTDQFLFGFAIGLITIPVLIALVFVGFAVWAKWNDRRPPAGRPPEQPDIHDSWR